MNIKANTAKFYYKDVLLKYEKQRKNNIEKKKKYF